LFLAPLLLGLDCEPLDDPEEEEEIADYDLRGEIAGEPWIFVQGDATPVNLDTPGYDPYFQARFFAGSYPTCDKGPGELNWFRMRFDLGEGYSESELAEYIRFTDDGELMPGLSDMGQIRIDEITAETITGGLVIGSGSNRLNGHFVISNCDHLVP
jgi:hypothetical protein